MGFFKKRFHSFSFAFKGIKIAFCTQPNAWIHTVAAVFAIAGGIFFKVNPGEWVFIVLAIGCVFAAEIINTSIEKLVDMISPEFHEKAGKVKDLAAGAVLVASLMALIIGCIIFIPKIMHLFSKGIV